MIKFKTMPLISVIVPCYNQAQYLDECLQSVLDQTYTDWECIIVNDGSPDNTEEIAAAEELKKEILAVGKEFRSMLDTQKRFATQVMGIKSVPKT